MPKCVICGRDNEDVKLVNVITKPVYSHGRFTRGCGFIPECFIDTLNSKSVYVFICEKCAHNVYGLNVNVEEGAPYVFFRGTLLSSHPSMYFFDNFSEVFCTNDQDLVTDYVEYSRSTFIKTSLGLTKYINDLNFYGYTAGYFSSEIHNTYVYCHEDGYYYDNSACVFYKNNLVPIVKYIKKAICEFCKKEVPYVDLFYTSEYGYVCFSCKNYIDEVKECGDEDSIECDTFSLKEGVYDICVEFLECENNKYI